ncbi:MAG: carbon storage regulator CsrA [Planctomycetota bacterium]
MLVLSRGKDESIMVGDNVEIVVVDISRNKIRLGIIAPKVVPVYRKEIYGRIRRERDPSSPKGFAVAGLRLNERPSMRSRHRNTLAVEA